MKRLSILLAVLFIIATLWNCAPKNVSSSVDLSRYKTYSWAETTPAKSTFSPAGGNTTGKKIIELDIRNAVDKELKARGLVEVKSNADLIVNTKAVLEKEDNSSQLNWTKPGYSRSNEGFWGSSNTGSGTNQPQVVNTATLKVDLLDASNKSSIWSATKVRQIGEVMSLTELLEKDIKGLFKKIPKTTK